MTEIYMFGNFDTAPSELCFGGAGLIPTPVDADDLRAYFHETELRGRDVAIVYESDEDEHAAGEIYGFMECSDAYVEPFCNSEGALKYFQEWRPEILFVSAALTDLRNFLKAYREMEK